MANKNQEKQWLEFSLIVEQDQVEKVINQLTGIMPSGLVTERIYDGVFPHELDLVMVPVRIYGYLPINDQIDNLRASIISALLELSSEMSLPAPVFKPLKNRSWATAWQERYVPIPLGLRLIIVPTWLENPQPERLEINMDPGMAFGSGTHPTTQLSLILLESLLAEVPVQKMIDIGSGSGILSIAGCKLGVNRVLGVDNDPEAVRVSVANADQNQVINQVDFQLGSVEEILNGKYGLTQAPLVTANIIAPVLSKLFDKGLADVISPGGTLLLSGILKEQLPGMLDLLKNKLLIVRKQIQEENWIALRVEKPPNLIPKV
ncbi:MAG: 50S ribosomal protein L11 methyltransferase [Anaerolineales bacterium]